MSEHSKEPLLTRIAAYAYLVRWPNLLMLIFIQICAHTLCSSSLKGLSLGAIAITILAAAAGFVINDICDQEADSANGRFNVLNSGNVNAATAHNVYWTIIIIGMFLSGVLSETLSPHFVWIFPLASFGLWVYSGYLKGRPVIGNLAVSAFCALAVPLVCLPGIFSATLLQLSAFAFVLTWVREIVKDIEDIDGDRRAGYKTLPIVAGGMITRSLVLLLTFGTVTALAILWYRNGLSGSLISDILLFVTASLLLYISAGIVLKSATRKDLHGLSTVIKLSMLSGTLSFVL